MPESVAVTDMEILHLLRSVTRRRVARVVMYALLFLGSLVSVVEPSQIFIQEASELTVRTWSILFGSSAVLCFLGSLMDRWVVEYIMLPILYTSFGALSLVLGYNAWDNSNYLALPYSLFFLAFAAGLFARWKDTKAIRVALTSLGDK